MQDNATNNILYVFAEFWGGAIHLHPRGNVQPDVSVRKSNVSAWRNRIFRSSLEREGQQNMPGSNNDDVTHSAENESY